MSEASFHRVADVFMHGQQAGQLIETSERTFRFEYAAGYDGPPVSLTMPVGQHAFAFARFPPFFDGLLPEGWQLEALLRSAKLDRQDYMGQLLAVGADTVGAVTILPAGESDE